jgi:nucleoid-associated protein YgaU
VCFSYNLLEIMMGILNFIKGAGEKLFGGSEAQAAPPASDAPTAAASAPVPSQEERNAKAATAIAAFIQTQGLNLPSLQVTFDGATSTVILEGVAETQGDAEKAALSAGNIANVTAVENRLSVNRPEPEAQYHDVAKGETLSAIAKKYYGNANEYPRIFEANRPLLSHPDKIYPGQKLRIPAQ